MQIKNGWCNPITNEIWEHDEYSMKTHKFFGKIEIMIELIENTTELYICTETIYYVIRFGDISNKNFGDEIRYILDEGFDAQRLIDICKIKKYLIFRNYITITIDMNNILDYNFHRGFTNVD